MVSPSFLGKEAQDENSLSTTRNLFLSRCSMPRGFLVKRFSKTSSPAACPSTLLPSSLSPSRVRRYSDEDRSDTSSDHELLPDSSEVLKTVFCGRPPPLCPDKTSRDDNLSPTFLELSQDVPLALTTEKIKSPPNGNLNSTFSSLKNSVFYLQRHENKQFTPSTPPPPLKSNPPKHPHSAPAVATALHQAQTPKSNSCQPPKKRVTDSSSAEAKTKAAKRAKVVRKLNFDEDKSSPVSGTFIRDIDDDEVMLATSHPSAIRRGDIDPSLNVVIITEEARAELAKIENKIGDYVCQLCKEHYDDAFGLAQHRCSRIVHVEYRCPECDKVFNCPANLASHRRWHKPRPPPATKTTTNATNASKPLSNSIAKSEIKIASADAVNGSIGVKSRDSFSAEMSDSESVIDTPPPEPPSTARFSSSDDKDFECHLCYKKFSQYFHFRKHLLSHLTTLTSNANGEQESEAIQSVFSKSNSEKRIALARLNVTPPPENEKFAEKNGFSCTICGMVFQTKTEMEQHTFKHDELKGIQCKYCPSVFYSSAGLTRHINKHHPSENRQVLLLHVPALRPLST